ncbi:ABC transporter substrate-binding protein [Kibdelosporangium philippinense]|uniref:ABC transporter substrate-binding protein n=1 Tax=Kibdelosporangium philippinense TaxID=211113 RepID=A0ABS8Z6S6_9PSEU|nr:ABC transporter substrate-binding protein [Kibdelosporangium philippinense]MCE7003586.1 ABC transporter substrate-binding protein [Kibdelosporangium philippinense]
MKRPLFRSLMAIVAVTALAACDSGSSGAQQVPTGTAISAARCAQNKAAGKITFLTGYYYQASASILEYVAAKKLGYFDALCLDVGIQPGTGDTGHNTQLLASGQATVSPVSEQDVIQARDNGVNVEGISAYSNAGLEILMTMPDVTALNQLNGTTLGHRGALPIGVQVMLVDAGADLKSIKQVTVGYDSSVLTRGQVKSLTGFVSNEPNLLKAAGTPVTAWRPYDYHVPGSLGGMAVNPAFAAKNPTAVQDFLRAGLHAYEYCSAKSEECVGYASDLSAGGYDKAHNLKIWQTETALVQETKPAATPLGTIDLNNVAALADLLARYSVLKNPATAEQAKTYFDNSFVSAIYDSGKLVWPAP